MQPMKPQQKQEILDRNPSVTSAEIEEYEQLSAQRFRVDPDAPLTAAEAALAERREARLAELNRKFSAVGILNESR